MLGGVRDRYPSGRGLEAASLSMDRLNETETAVFQILQVLSKYFGRIPYSRLFTKLVNGRLCVVESI